MLLHMLALLQTRALPRRYTADSTERARLPTGLVSIASSRTEMVALRRSSCAGPWTWAVTLRSTRGRAARCERGRRGARIAPGEMSDASRGNAQVHRPLSRHQ